jgi:uncharacterized protein (TIGR01319 family)
MTSMRVDPEQLRTVLVTDCGSTTTKALLFERTPEGWRQTSRGEAPTTVEEPVADVTVGARNAFVEVQELSGRTILREDAVSADAASSPFVITEGNAAEGIDLYLSTSSAGGGLQMLVTGVVHDITLESAQRAALGAGAIVIESVSADDGREDHERIDRIRHVKPDIVLVTGGTDGGATAHVVEMAEVLVAAAPRPRFGDTLKLPVIYAGNSAAAEEVRRILGEMAQVVVVANVRPELESENLGPAREAIHEFFLSHVMSHSPGYATLMSWTPVPIQPTPSAVGCIVERYAHDTQQNVLCVDIGGATTDVFSVFRDKAGAAVFNRTVSANLGMSYSVANVLVEAGVENIRRWLPFDITVGEVRDRLRNKMIRPTSIPQTVEDLWLEQAVCREALRLSLAHHRSLAVKEEGQRERGIADIFKQSSGRYELVDMMKLDTVIGSGGVLSHAPNRMQAALMMIDGFGLEGITQLCVDSIFMMPHLGVFSSVHPDAAREIFERDCLVYLGASVVPVYGGKYASAAKLADVYIDGALVGNIKPNEVQVVAREMRREVTLHVVPYTNGIDVGAGAGAPSERRVQLGECGVVLDGRGIRGVEQRRPRGAEQVTTAQFQATVYRSCGLS